MANSEDMALIVQFNEGDRKAFNELVLKYQKQVFSIVYRFLGDYEESRDITQDVFVRIYEALPKFRKESSFFTWIYRITINICKNNYRDKKRKPYIESIDAPIQTEEGEMNRSFQDPESDVQELAEKNELKSKVHNAISSLNSNFKEVIILRDIQGFSYEKISQILKIREGTVKSRISRARLILKDKLKEVIKHEM